MCLRTEKACGCSLSTIQGPVVTEPPELCHLRTTFLEVPCRRTEVELETVTNKIQAKHRKTMQTAHFGTYLECQWAHAHPVSARAAAGRVRLPIMVIFWTDFGGILDYSGTYYAWTLHVSYQEGFLKCLHHRLLQFWSTYMVLEEFASCIRHFCYKFGIFCDYNVQYFCNYVSLQLS